MRSGIFKFVFVFCLVLGLSFGRRIVFAEEQGDIPASLAYGIKKGWPTDGKESPKQKVLSKKEAKAKAKQGQKEAKAKARKAKEDAKKEKAAAANKAEIARQKAQKVSEKKAAEAQKFKDELENAQKGAERATAEASLKAEAEKQSLNM